MPPFRVHGHDIHRADGGRVFAAHQFGALPDALDLLGQIALQMILHTILDQTGVLAQVIGFVAVDVLERDLQDVAGLVRADAQHLLRDGGVHVGVRVGRDDLLDRARRGHPIQRLV